MIAMKTKFLLLFAILSIFVTSMVLQSVRAENNTPVAYDKNGSAIRVWFDPTGMPHWEVEMKGVYGIRGTAWFTGWSGAYSGYSHNDWRGQYYHKMSISKTWLAERRTVCESYFPYPCYTTEYSDRWVPGNHWARMQY